MAMSSFLIPVPLSWIWTIFSIQPVTVIIMSVLKHLFQRICWPLKNLSSSYSVHHHELAEHLNDNGDEEDGAGESGQLELLQRREG